MKKTKQKKKNNVTLLKNKINDSSSVWDGENKNSKHL